jgi:hypothetical protein
MRGRLVALSLLLAGIVVPASSALPAAPQQPIEGLGGIGIRLVDAPADAHGTPRAHSYIVDELAAGAVIRRRVEIVNSTRKTWAVAVYPAAASLRRGSFAFAAARGQNELSGWTSVSRAGLRLAAGGRELVTVTIKVPKAAAAGKRFAVIWAEVSAPAPATGGVKLVSRVGLRVYLSISAGRSVRSNFAISSLSAARSASGAPLVVATVHNSGRRTLKISGILTLSKGLDGLRAGPFPVATGPSLAPGRSKRLIVMLDKQFPDGPWHAQIRLTSGSITRVAVATISFPGRRR